MNTFLITFFVLHTLFIPGESTKRCIPEELGKDVISMEGILGNDIAIPCNLPTEFQCSGGIWHDFSNLHQWLEPAPCPECGDQFNISESNTKELMRTTLNVYNASVNHTGLYGCYCHTLNEDHLVKCFQLNILNLSCRIEFVRNGQIEVSSNVILCEKVQRIDSSMLLLITTTCLVKPNFLLYF